MEIIPIRTIIKPNLFESFSIRDVQDLLSGKDMIQELHRHDFFYILALEKGKGTHEIDFISYEIRDNVVFFMRPGQVHQLTLDAGSTGYLLQFKSAFYYPHNKANVYYPSTNKPHSILAYIFEEHIDKQEGYQKVIKANLDILFIELARQVTVANVSIYNQERLDEFTSLLETHISAAKQASQYAEMMNLSLYQLNTITKTALGKTCSELINEYIILESKRYLLATSNQINQIADLLGYEDPSYFIRFFKKHTGYSPEAFRQKSC
jgi:AraC-like DNA-binding protein